MNIEKSMKRLKESVYLKQREKIRDNLEQETKKNRINKETKKTLQEFNSLIENLKRERNLLKTRSKQNKLEFNNSIFSSQSWVFKKDDKKPMSISKTAITQSNVFSSVNTEFNRSDEKKEAKNVIRKREGNNTDKSLETNPTIAIFKSKTQALFDKIRYKLQSKSKGKTKKVSLSKHSFKNLSYMNKEKNNKVSLKNQSAVIVRDQKINEQLISNAIKDNRSLTSIDQNINNDYKKLRSLKKENTKIKESHKENLTKKKERKFNEAVLISAATNVGSTRTANEDRISITLNVPYKNKKYSYLSVFDGHGGSYCSEYLKKNLYKSIIAHKSLFDNFPSNITRIFRNMDSEFIRKAEDIERRDGSCALTLFLFEGRIIIANTGDCRALASIRNGQEIRQLTVDHKPENKEEQKRVLDKGGYFYSTNTVIIKRNSENAISGPLRVFPGRLTTTRSFGDFEAKLPHHGGVEGVVICDPELSSQNSKSLDFIVMGSDGLFESITNEEIVNYIHKKVKNIRKKGNTLNQALSNTINKDLVNYAIQKGSSDNISSILIFFEKYLK